MQRLTGHLMRSLGFGDQPLWVVLGQQIVVVAAVGVGFDADEATMLTAEEPAKIL